MKSGKRGGNICNHLPGTQAQFKVFRKCSNLLSMEKRLGMLFLDQNYGNSSGKVKTWHISMISKYADPVGTRHTKKDTMLCAKDFREKKNQKMWGMKLSLPLPQHALLRKALGLQMRVSNDSQTGLLHRHSRHSFHSSLTWPSWGEGTCFRQGCKWEEEQGHTLVSRMNYHGEQSLREGAWPTSLLVALAPRFTLHSHCSPPQHMFCLPFTSSQRTP